MPVCAMPSCVFDGVIDVSHHNGAIDWPAVAAAGIVLSFIKATQGTGFVDRVFEANRRGAAAAGIAVVPYHFLDPGDGEAQAAHFLDVAGLGTGQPGMLDWETAATAVEAAAFGAAVTDRTQRDPVAYYGFAQLAVAQPELARWPLMLPAYPRGNLAGRYETLVSRAPRLPPGRPARWGGAPRPYDFHQYTPAGHIAGIATPVDRSIWVGTAAELRLWFATGAIPGATA